MPVIRSAAALALLLAPLALAAADPSPAPQPGVWIDLLQTGPNGPWREVTKDWIFTDAVTLDPANPKRLKAEPKDGGAVWVNGVKGRTKDLYTKASYGDLEVHVEFLIAKGSNAGVKMQGVYEVQILDTFGKKELTGDSMGGIYPKADVKPKYHHIDDGIAPKVNAAKPAGEWQTMDLVWQAPRFDADGKKVANAKLVRAEVNGQVVHDNQELAHPTGNNYVLKEKPSGPLMLQADHGPVAFRNVRVRVPAAK